MLVKRSGPVGCCRRGIICRHYCCAHQNRACNCHAQGGQCSGSSHYFLPRAKRRIVKRCTMLYKTRQVKVAIFVSILIKLCNFCCNRSRRCAPGASMSQASDSRTRAVSSHHIEAKPAATGAKAYLSGEDVCRCLNLQASYAVVKPATTHLTRMPSIDNVGPVRYSVAAVGARSKSGRGMP